MNTHKEACQDSKDVPPRGKTADVVMCALQKEMKEPKRGCEDLTRKRKSGL
jgi:hypothetical protein